MARVCRQGTGRVVLLAHDKSIMKVVSIFLIFFFLILLKSF